MNPEIEKLIIIAKDSGDLTEKQKEIILRKAEKLGEDIDEVEMLLESLTNRQETTIKRPKQRVRRCPNCGASVPASAMKCPECGLTMEHEAESDTQNRDIIAEIERQLRKIDSRRRRANEEYDYDFEDNKNTEKLRVIRAFSVPKTRDALLIAYNYAYSNYLTNQNAENESFERKMGLAWLSKAKEFYSNIASMNNLDEDTLRWLDNNKDVLGKKGKRVLTIGGKIGLLGIIILVLGAAYLEWTQLPWGAFWKCVTIFFTLYLLLLIIALPRKEI